MVRPARVIASVVRARAGNAADLLLTQLYSQVTRKNARLFFFRKFLLEFCLHGQSPLCWQSLPFTIAAEAALIRDSRLLSPAPDSPGCQSGTAGSQNGSPCASF